MRGYLAAAAVALGCRAPSLDPRHAFAPLGIEVAGPRGRNRLDAVLGGTTEPTVAITVQELYRTAPADLDAAAIAYFEQTLRHPRADFDIGRVAAGSDVALGLDIDVPPGYATPLGAPTAELDVSYDVTSHVSDQMFTVRGDPALLDPLEQLARHATRSMEQR